MTKNANLQLIQYKITHRTHYTAQKLFKMGFRSELCSYCTENCPDTYIHATWQCAPVRQFWIKVTESLSLILGSHIPLSPSLCLLGDVSSLNFYSSKNKLLLVALTIAKKTILLNWKSRNSLNLAQWKNLLSEYISLENLASPLNHTVEHQDHWSPFLDFLHA